MKFITTLSVLPLLFAIAGTHGADLATPATNTASRELNRVVAIVNDDVILASELNDEIAAIVAQLRAKGTELPEQSVLVKQVLERLVLKQLQLEIASRGGITVDDATLNSKLQEMARENNLSLTEFRAVLERDGYDYGGFREEVRQQMLINQVRAQMIGNRVQVSDLEADNLLATLKASGESGVQFHLAHILIAIPEAASPEQIQAAEQRAQDIEARLQGGADFTQIAIAESDAQTALEGGDIGWRSLGQVPSLFLDTVKDMQVGAVSGLIRSAGGFHIITLLEKRGGERHVVNQTRARHILIKPDTINTDEDVRLRMEQLVTRIRGGEDFETLARSHSQDTMSAAKGGDLGWISPGDTVPEFEKALEKLEPGVISAPLKSQFGWHIIQVQERRTHDSTEEFERSRARQLIKSRKYDEELFLWLRRLRDEAYVEYRLDNA